MHLSSPQKTVQAEGDAITQVSAEVQALAFCINKGPLYLGTQSHQAESEEKGLGDGMGKEL